MRFVEGIVAGAGLLVVALALMPRAAAGRLTVRNHRGLPVPAVLGPALAAVAVVVPALSNAAHAAWGGPFARIPWRVVVALAIVAGAGILDDLATHGPRGVRAHLRALAAGRLTTGIIKLAAIVAAAAIALYGFLPDAAHLVLGVIVAAGSANLWNGLDVVPGRAVKAFLAVMAVLMLYLPTLPFALLLGAAVVALRVDLRERAMLGDAGANLLGFTVGLGLALRLATWQLAVAAAVMVALNVLAETVTLSRVIDAAPPLRWVDRLGRREPRPAPRSAPRA
jgi:UDP-GlcNAc:undecaprenyl-phosphate/decaprenyl-phosphate GlcNAc-1-phosphate transferase